MVDRRHQDMDEDVGYCNEGASSPGAARGTTTGVRPDGRSCAPGADRSNGIVTPLGGSYLERHCCSRDCCGKCGEQIARQWVIELPCHGHWTFGRVPAISARSEEPESAIVLSQSCE
jgi:hypothetical protein